MSRVRILTVEDTEKVVAWLASTPGILGTAVSVDGTAWSIAASSSTDAFTIPTRYTPVVESVMAAVVADGRRLWADSGTGVAKAIAIHSKLDVTLFDQVGCVQTMRAVLRPGAEAAKRPSSPHLSSGSVAREVAAFSVERPVEERRLALESVRQDALWRPRQMMGMTLDMQLLTTKTPEVLKAKRDMAIANGIDLTADSDDVFAWVAASGIKITDADGKPSLSRDHFGKAVVPEESLPAWKVFREARSLKSSMDKLLELRMAEKDGRIYPKVVIRHAVTGRGSVLKPALQNISGPLRPLLAAAPGKVLVSLDLNRCEVMLAADISGDADLAAALTAGDPYVALLVAQYGEEHAGDSALRGRLKRALVASLYGQGAKSLASNLGISTDEAAKLKADLKSQWPRVFAWIQENTKAASTGVVGRTATGRPTPVLPAKDPTDEDSRDEFYKRTNHIVQGSGADYLYRGVARIVDRLGAEVLYLTVHDEVVLEVNPKDAEAACAVLVECMSFDLPGGLVLTGEAQVLGTSWGK